MKARIPFNKTQLKAMSSVVNKNVNQGLIRAQWLMIIALHEELGIGAKRILRVLNRYPELLIEYENYKKDDLADEMVLRKLKEIGIMAKDSKTIFDEHI